jgi:hypothetical protein
MFATLLAVLALAGAPASTHVVCNPNLPPGLFGRTDGAISDTTFVRVDQVELGPLACGAVLYTSASPEERAAIRQLNPSIDFDRLAGAGLLVALHEATHVALASSDECLVERTALAGVPALLSQVADHPEAASQDAVQFDRLFAGCSR